MLSNLIEHKSQLGFRFGVDSKTTLLFATMPSVAVEAADALAGRGDLFACICLKSLICIY